MATRNIGLAKLNKKIWYRFLKVVYIFISIVSFAIVIIIAWSNKPHTSSYGTYGSWSSVFWALVVGGLIVFLLLEITKRSFHYIAINKSFFDEDDFSFFREFWNRVSVRRASVAVIQTESVKAEPVKAESDKNNKEKTGWGYKILAFGMFSYLISEPYRLIFEKVEIEPERLSVLSDYPYLFSLTAVFFYYWLKRKKWSVGSSFIVTLIVFHLLTFGTLYAVNKNYLNNYWQNVAESQGYATTEELWDSVKNRSNDLKAELSASYNKEQKLNELFIDAPSTNEEIESNVAVVVETIDLYRERIKTYDALIDYLFNDVRDILGNEAFISFMQAEGYGNEILVKKKTSLTRQSFLAVIAYYEALNEYYNAVLLGKSDEETARLWDMVEVKSAESAAISEQLLSEFTDEQLNGSEQLFEEIVAGDGVKNEETMTITGPDGEIMEIRIPQ